VNSTKESEAYRDAVDRNVDYTMMTVEQWIHTHEEEYKKIDTPVESWDAYKDRAVAAMERRNENLFGYQVCHMLLYM
jgi:hypothetical protein